MLSVKDLHFSYRDTEVLKGVSFKIRRGEVVSVVGPNGVGKTTLIKCVVGIARPSKGRILLDGTDIGNMSRREVAKLLAYVPQNVSFKFPTTVFEAVLSGRRPYFGWWPSRRDLLLVEEILCEVGLSDVAMRHVDGLSGGQAQKVLIAMAVVQRAPYMLLDEPTSNLDLCHQLEVMEMLVRMARTKGIGVFMAVHDLNAAARFSDLVVILKDGRVLQAGPAEEVITEENIRTVYGVEAAVHRSGNGLSVQPLKRAASR